MSGTGKVAAFGAGIMTEYLLDPQEGKRRRHMLRDRTMAKLRRGSREAEKKARYARDRAQGAIIEATSSNREGASQPG